jgi:hypothetical protein
MDFYLNQGSSFTISPELFFSNLFLDQYNARKIPVKTPVTTTIISVIWLEKNSMWKDFTTFSLNVPFQRNPLSLWENSIQTGARRISGDKMESGPQKGVKKNPM